MSFPNAERFRGDQAAATGGEQSRLCPTPGDTPGPMTLASTLAIAVALAMDAFAVSVAAGLALDRITPRRTFRLAFHFGLFQALMPILGWAGGLTVRSRIEAWDHWVALTLLAFVGGRMLWEAVRGGGSDDERRDPTRGWTLVVLSVATSIDALAVGLSLSVLQVSIWLPALVIGLVALAFTAAGLHLGRLVGGLDRLARAANVLGGLVLIGIGLHILWDHGAISL